MDHTTSHRHPHHWHTGHGPDRALAFYTTELGFQTWLDLRPESPLIIRAWWESRNYRHPPVPVPFRRGVGVVRSAVATNCTVAEPVVVAALAVGPCSWRRVPLDGRSSRR